MLRTHVVQKFKTRRTNKENSLYFFIDDHQEVLRSLAHFNHKMKNERSAFYITLEDDLCLQKLTLAECEWSFIEHHLSVDCYFTQNMKGIDRPCHYTATYNNTLMDKLVIHIPINEQSVLVDEIQIKRVDADKTTSYISPIPLILNNQIKKQAQTAQELHNKLRVKKSEYYITLSANALKKEVELSTAMDKKPLTIAIVKKLARELQELSHQLTRYNDSFIDGREQIMASLLENLDAPSALSAPQKASAGAISEITKAAPQSKKSAKKEAKPSKKVQSSLPLLDSLQDLRTKILTLTAKRATNFVQATEALQPLLVKFNDDLLSLEWEPSTSQTKQFLQHARESIPSPLHVEFEQLIMEGRIDSCGLLFLDELPLSIDFFVRHTQSCYIHTQEQIAYYNQKTNQLTTIAITPEQLINFHDAFPVGTSYPSLSEQQLKSITILIEHTHEDELRQLFRFFAQKIDIAQSFKQLISAIVENTEPSKTEARIRVADFFYEHSEEYRSMIVLLQQISGCFQSEDGAIDEFSKLIGTFMENNVHAFRMLLRHGFSPEGIQYSCGDLSHMYTTFSAIVTLFPNNPNIEFCQALLDIGLEPIHKHIKVVYVENSSLQLQAPDTSNALDAIHNLSESRGHTRHLLKKDMKKLSSVTIKSKQKHIRDHNENSNPELLIEEGAHLIRLVPNQSLTLFEFFLPMSDIKSLALRLGKILINDKFGEIPCYNVNDRMAPIFDRESLCLDYSSEASLLSRAQGRVTYLYCFVSDQLSASEKSEHEHTTYPAACLLHERFNLLFNEMSSVEQRELLNTLLTDIDGWHHHDKKIIEYLSAIRLIASLINEPDETIYNAIILSSVRISNLWNDPIKTQHYTHHLKTFIDNSLPAEQLAQITRSTYYTRLSEMAKKKTTQAPRAGLSMFDQRFDQTLNAFDDIKSSAASMLNL